jgi:dTMP kinase
MKMASEGAGLFFVVEGIDGAGTTTQAKRLSDALREREIECHLTREPSDGPIGRLLREILAGDHKPNDATSLGLLFAADRADHLQREIEPALAAGKVVISDRYYHSSLAYQGSEEDRGWIATLNQRARTPDCTYFLQVDPEVAAQRRSDDDRSEEIFDHLDTQRRVAEGYLAVVRDMRESECIEVIDGQLPLDDISERMLSSVQEKLSTRVGSQS